jgi:hypothetical protein
MINHKLVCERGRKGTLPGTGEPENKDKLWSFRFHTTGKLLQDKAFKGIPYAISRGGGKAAVCNHVKSPEETGFSNLSFPPKVFFFDSFMYLPRIFEKWMHGTIMYCS